MAEPIRMCLGCRQRMPKRTLIRLVAPAEGPISVDRTGKQPGRGAYVCPKRECVEAALHVKRLQRAFRRAISESAIAELHAELSAVIGEQESIQNAPELIHR